MADKDEGDLHFQLSQVLHAHWLHDLGCSHEGDGSNQALCGCGWLGDRVENVGAAKTQWVNHVLEAMREPLIRFGAAEQLHGPDTSAEVAAIAGELLNLTADDLDNVAWHDPGFPAQLLTKIHKVAASALGQRQ